MAERKRAKHRAAADGSGKPAAGGPVWASLVSEPQTGVSVITAAGTIVYLNAQAAEIFLGPRVTVEDATGAKLDALYPPEFADERARLVRGVIERDQPVLFRAMWRGHQHLSWIYPIHAEDGHTTADAQPQPKVLVITRRTGGDAADAVMSDTGLERIDAGVINLGPLDILSPRELVVLALLGRGMSIKEAARHLHRAPATIETQRENIGKKLRLADRGELVQLVQRVGLTIDDAERTAI
ncbi:MAG: LuxR C-terminal-related transcriptional regulator [Planctomycetota bacterium]